MELMNTPTKNNAIKYLDNATVGEYMTVCIDNRIRCVSLYMGQDEDKRYTFIDSTGIYKYSKQFIQTHNIALDAIRGEAEMTQLAQLVDSIKRV